MMDLRYQSSQHLKAWPIEASGASAHTVTSENGDRNDLSLQSLLSFDMLKIITCFLGRDNLNFAEKLNICNSFFPEFTEISKYTFIQTF